MPLQEAFFELLQGSAQGGPTPESGWEEVVRRHSEKHRHYHKLQHLEDIHAALSIDRGTLDGPDAVLIAIAFHDSVYAVHRKDNEERSAALMRTLMAPFHLPAPTIERAVRHILATKDHTASQDPDTDLFTDADLSILGADAERYDQYTRQIRSEFAIYPDLLYKPGRRKVLQHFLTMPSIFKTTLFRERFEAQAKANLERELLASS